jgi:hypothetical protein
MSHDQELYEDLSTEELADEIAGLDKEIEGLQVSIARNKRCLKQKDELRETLIDLLAINKQGKRWKR